MKFYITLVDKKTPKITISKLQLVGINFLKIRPIVYMTKPTISTIDIKSVCSTPSFYSVNNFVLSVVLYIVSIASILIVLFTLLQLVSCIFIFSVV